MLEQTQETKSEMNAKNSLALGKMKVNLGKLNLNYKLLGRILGAFLILFLIYWTKGFIIAAVVNGKPIPRNMVTKELERRSGQQILEGLINQALIEQEAKDRGVTATQQEVDADIAKIEQNLIDQGSTMEEALLQQNLSKAQFTTILRTNILLQKLLADRIVITEEEITKYMEENKDSLPADSDQEALKTQVTSYLRQQKEDAESQKLFTDLRAKAKIWFWAKY